MSGELRDQVVVVTGASSGVGRACARAFGRQRARVALIARNEEALTVAAQEIRDSGGDALVLPLDVADAEAVERAAANIEGQWGGIDIWVNVAMLTVFAPVSQMTPEEYRRVTNVTYLGYVNGTLSALRRMRPRNRGSIIQVGSALAYRSIPLQSAYCAAKAAIRGFTDSLRSELMHEGSKINLSMLQLPAVNTPQATRQRNKMEHESQPVPPMFDPEVIAETIVWGAIHPQREMLIGRSTVQAFLGQAIAPSLMDRMATRMGYRGQLNDQPHDPSEPDILFETLPGDPGAHGPHRDRERGADLQMKLRTHPRSVLAGAAAAFALGALAIIRRL